MVMTRLIKICATLIVVTLLAVVISLQAQGKPAAQASLSGVSASGRWQVVNGSPTALRTVMLLDTATGDTWIFCASADKVDGWCRMSRSDAGASAGK